MDMASASTERRNSGGGRQLEERVRSDAGDLVTTLRDYARQNPDTAALWCFAIGFILGWRLKPW